MNCLDCGGSPVLTASVGVQSLQTEVLNVGLQVGGSLGLARPRPAGRGTQRTIQLLLLQLLPDTRTESSRMNGFHPLFLNDVGVSRFENYLVYRFFY